MSPMEDMKRRDFVAPVAFTEVQIIPAGRVCDGAGGVDILKTVLHHAACLTVATTFICVQS